MAAPTPRSIFKGPALLYLVFGLRDIDRDISCRKDGLVLAPQSLQVGLAAL